PEVLLGHPTDYCWIAHFQHLFTNISLGPLLEDDGSLPDLSTFTEDKLCEYLNAIIYSFHCYNYTSLREPLRYWNANYCGTVLKNDTGISMKPDIILVNLVNGMMKMNKEQITWCNVYLVSKVTSQATYHPWLRNTITSKSYMIDKIGLNSTMVQEPASALRSGQTLLHDHATWAHRINCLRSDPPLVTAVKQKLPHPWLDVPHSMANIPVKYILKPLTFDLMPENFSGITHITVGDQVYRIHQELFSAQTLVGQGTRVWLAEDVSTAVKVIIKDSWILPSQVDAADFISELNGLPHTPTLVTKWGGPSTTEV
ncbi:hypothetical protein DXG01_001148, partial [Tephrocybe rancida]